MKSNFLFLLLGLSLTSCIDQNIHGPKPTDTVVADFHNEGNEKKGRKQWIDQIHGGATVNWMTIEANNALQYYHNVKLPSSRDGEEIFANGAVKGKWRERGSNNLAGNVMNCTYDSEEEIIYAIGGGGPLFRGDLLGYNWELVNDKFRFSTNLLELVKPTPSSKRLISAINGQPHYSDDFGKTWTKATGALPTTDGWDIYNSMSSPSGEIFYLGKRDYWANYGLLYSKDFGVSYKVIQYFNTNDGNNLAFSMGRPGDQLYLVQKNGSQETNVYIFDRASEKLNLIRSSPLAISSDAKLNLQCIVKNDTTFFYSYDEDQDLFVSKDLGISWETNSALSSSPWSVGLFVVPSNPKFMLYGEVDAYRSINSGKSWQAINYWYEYYSNFYTKLHADIMCIKEFRKSNGQYFLLIGNHGGISISYDYGKTTENIGFGGLNVSQYYDVVTSPINPKLVFAGAQDQGWQRAYVEGDFPSDFYQPLSGDYGHLTFTGNGAHFWTVYPGGSISFYTSPETQNYPVAGYEINSKRESVWIPPIIAGFDKSQDVVYAAGGSISNLSEESHIIQLSYSSETNDITAEELPFDFSISGGEIASMAISPFDPNIWFVATTNGKFYKSTDGAQTFQLKQNMVSDAHYLYGSCILALKTDPNIVFLSGNGYGNLKPVYMSTNGGESFVPMSTGLPPTTAFKLVANDDESLVFAATETGPFVYVANQSRWFSLIGESTPNQTYWSVEFVSDLQTARFGTYGRGIWDFQLSNESATVDNSANFHIDVYPNPTTDFFSINTEQEVSSVTLYDLSGNKKMSDANPGKKQMNVKDLLPGIYLVEMTITSGKRIIKKLIKG